MHVDSPPTTRQLFSGWEDGHEVIYGLVGTVKNCTYISLPYNANVTFSCYIQYAQLRASKPNTLTSAYIRMHSRGHNINPWHNYCYFNRELIFLLEYISVYQSYIVILHIKFI